MVLSLKEYQIKWTQVVSYTLASYATDRDKELLLPWRYKYYPFGDDGAIAIAYKRRKDAV